MLLNSVIIILREVLEAALLFSILIALSKHLKLNINWFYSSLGIGLICALLYAMNIHYVSEWFDGVGQEVVNALQQLVTYLMIITYLLLISYFFYKNKISNYLINFVMVFIGTLAITREGSEIILYIFSMIRNDTNHLSVIVGMIIGVSIGISVGLLFYYLLRSLKPSRAFFISIFLLLLVASGMISQAALLLIQADIFPAQLPLWDSSNLISEKSVIGQLLYALIGYESTPTPIQAGFYLVGFILPASLILGLKYKVSK